MFRSFSNSWQLVKASFAVLRSDRDLLMFPIISTIGTIIVSLVFFLPLSVSGLLEAVSSEEGLTQAQSIIGLILAFLFYFTMYTVVIFSNTALVGAAMMRLRGEDPTVADGMRIASERIGTILGYAAISATIGMILNAIRDEDNFLSQIFAGFLEMAWNLITFLVIPVLVVENVGPIEAIKRSSNLLKRTWGENIAGTFSMGIISFLVGLAVVVVIGGPLLFIASAIGDVALFLAVAIVVILVMAVALFFSAMNGVFQAALYNYATEGEPGEFFEREMVAGAFHHK